MKKKILLGIAFTLYILFFWVGDSEPELKAGGTLLIIQILWIGRVFPLAYSSVLLVLILSFHLSSYEEVLSYLGALDRSMP
ncbi:hypothetical protein [Lentibacillus sp. CBA3610]|uniref:hypothetical protein n=1 Tax=Lentibacillus sp. CBA3610 TaxID=2518176 RepID=UPI00159608D2|nr:hypothetical protein [Lentibacillus sp. CBA3610]